MVDKIKNRLDRELLKYVRHIEGTYKLNRISALLSQSIRNFVLRDGKRIRPILFILGYCGFTKRKPTKLYTSALAMELLHDFMLVHDDIIDKSDTRRGQPSMHKILDSYIAKYKNIKFNGQDLAIVVGDILYAMAINAFGAIRENPKNKDAALKKLTEAVLYTGSGEFIELLLGAKKLRNTTKDDIYKIYDLKTAKYTFAYPLSIGSTLAGAGKKETDLLFDYGLHLGRAFQIKDDMLGMFGQQKKIGKSTLSDLQEAKKTLLIWYAYHNSGAKNRGVIEKIFNKKSVNRQDLGRMRNIMISTKTLDFARREVTKLINQAEVTLAKSKIVNKNTLSDYCARILKM